MRGLLAIVILLLSPFLMGFGPPALVESDEARAPFLANTVALVRETKSPAIGASSAVVIDGETGAVLFDKNAHDRRAPASMTKIVTAIIALEHGDLQDKVNVNVDAASMPGSSVMGLVPGDQLTLNDLLEGLLLPSGNDAALAIARHIGGTEAHFVEMMNAKVKELGLKDTHFVNPHGLDDPQHYSSAYDMAMLASYAMNNMTFANIVKTPAISITTQTRLIKLNNTNPLLGTYPGVDGVKTGSTEEAGQCVVASATQNGRKVFITLMDSNDRISDGKKLFDFAYKDFTLWSFKLPLSPLYVAHDGKGVAYTLTGASTSNVCLPTWQADSIWSELRFSGDPENVIDPSVPIGEIIFHPADEPTIGIPIYAERQ